MPLLGAGYLGRSSGALYLVITSSASELLGSERPLTLPLAIVAGVLALGPWLASAR